MNKKFSYFLILLGLSVQLLLAVLSLEHKGRTYDEAHHFLYALKIRQANTKHDLGNYSVLPFSVLNTLPSNETENLDSRIKKGRFVTIFFLLALSLLVFHWARELYGFLPASFSFFLFCLDPNFIAHGQLVMSDLYAAFAMTMASYFYWKFLKYGGMSRAVISAFALGLSQLAKYTSLSLYPMFLIIAFLRFFPDIAGSLKNKNSTSLKKLGFSLIRNFLLFFFISILTINIGFRWDRSFMPLKDYALKSSFKSFSLQHPLLSEVPIPLPAAFIEGMDLIKFVNETGATCHNSCLLGHIHQKGKEPLGFKGYFFIAILFKVPIAALIIMFLALAAYFRKFQWRNFIQNEIFLLLPAVVFLIYYNFFIDMNVGIRHILLIFPLLYIFCGSFFVLWDRYELWIKIFLIALMVYLLVSVLSYFPHYMRYFNEFVWDRKMAYKILSDSNLTLGGDEWFLKEYLQEYPGKVNPQEPASGRILVHVNKLVEEIEKFRWLRDNFEPSGMVGDSYLVYTIAPGSIKENEK